MNNWIKKDHSLVNLNLIAEVDLQGPSIVFYTSKESSVTWRYQDEREALIEFELIQGVMRSGNSVGRSIIV